MAKVYDAIGEDLTKWLGRQHVFFVATAPLSGDGHVNCSPKGGDTLRVLGPREIAYADGSGSGIETVAHLRENGRIVVMLCAFEGRPRIVRFHGTGTVVVPSDPRFPELLARFPPCPTVRSIVHVAVERIADSCGYGVPKMRYAEDRDDTAAYLRKSSDATMKKYLVKHNRRSVDGLPGMSAEELAELVIRRD